jgi:transposase-like protein
MAKYRTFSPDFKLHVVLELLGKEKTSSQLCQEHKITDTLLYRWKQEFLERAPSVFSSSQQETAAAQARIAELERMVGRLAMEVEAAKKVSTVLSSRSPHSGL